jgi:hypothetical protein
MAGFATLLLDPFTWDLVLGANGSQAIATPPYSLAQNAASAIKLLPGELWFDTTQGCNLLGQSLNVIRANCIAAAKTVPGVVSAQVFFTSFEKRVLQGQVQITAADGTVSAATF